MTSEILGFYHWLKILISGKYFYQEIEKPRKPSEKMKKEQRDRFSCLRLWRLDYQSLDVAELMQERLAEKQCTHVYKLKVSGSSFDPSYCLYLFIYLFIFIRGSCCLFLMHISLLEFLLRPWERGSGSCLFFLRAQNLSRILHIVGLVRVKDGFVQPVCRSPQTARTNVYRTELTGWNWTDLRIYSWKSVNI